MIAMPFGQHKGKRLPDIPAAYLSWLLTIDLQPWLQRAVERELAYREREDAERPREQARRRRGRCETKAPPPVDWDGLLRSWYREMSLRFHPDRGGSTEAMQAINHAYDRLRELAGVA
jgi:hypothetical protein